LYDWPVARTAGEVLPGLVVVAMLVGAAIRGLTGGRRWGFLIAWFLLILAPTSSIVPLNQVIFEHRTYLSLGAVVVLLAVGVHAAIRTLVRRRWLVPGAAMGVEICLAAVAVVVLGFLTIRRNEAYHSELSIWQDTVAKAPRNPKTQYSCGLALANVGRFREAIEHYQQAVELKPDYAQPHNNWGNALLNLNQPEQAIEHFRQALEISPQYAHAHNNLGFVLASLGRVEEAIEHYREAIRIRPDFAGAYSNQGLALASSDRPEEAIECYKTSLRLKPDYPEAQYNWGCALAALNRFPEAISHYDQALRIRPAYAEVHYNWGVAATALNQPAEAIKHYQQALWLKGDFPQARLNLSSVLARMGRMREAIDEGKEAVRQMPDDAQVKSFVAWLMATQSAEEGGNPTAAVELAEKACQQTGRKNVICLDTLAAVYAAGGRFAEAAATANEAWQLARAAGQASLAQEIHMRLQLYRDRKPYQAPAMAQP
jgi:tetratricopeptide (TPR) repeat protein